MPFYSGLRRHARDPAERARAAAKLIALRRQLESELPPRNVAETLLLATWNIREFDSTKYGCRAAESLYYIAEIVSHFDLVAVQEVRGDLAALDAVQAILGGWWKYVVTDVTEGSGGNDERMAFLYDSRKVVFAGLAGEIVLPPAKGRPVPQLVRTPFLCGFKAGWSKFNLCTVHIYYGDAKRNNPTRVREIGNLAELLAKRAAAGRTRQPARPEGAITTVRNREAENLILLGDFNIFEPEDETMKALLKPGFEIPEPLRVVPDRAKYYDQIVFLERRHRFGPALRAGVFDFYKTLFRLDEEPVYAAMMGEKYAASKKKSAYYKQWRTYQMSDHLVLWAELRIDFGIDYLEGLARDATRAAEPAPTPTERIADPPPLAARIPLPLAGEGGDPREARGG
jgi:endonuclease/exonuclease/phosphatase family metal-dependent hydrolase